MPYLEMKSQSSFGERSVDIEDSWSTTARSGSPPPPARVNRPIVSPNGHTSTPALAQTEVSAREQNNDLLGLGSQFAVTGTSR
ncbi:hypothetical protein M440DRAFT_1183667 [Trichoderma longibrachiatum ATCC 18648]|uniref:Uncharacterized protein n=1 Tax=Trichoderma longibrachiatum ATCC 18648 TaxID=983965 RepID=A0A2T4C931_TRILO|nr:hypothetical protein M440DRAFT_1183667 [Trichoderma longibrachiatum ATCC 18648]